MKRRKGHQVEYQGKKYDSLSELSKDLELPYSSIVHNYYRTKNVDKAVKIAQKAKEAEIYVVWGKKYCSVSKMANEYGISPATISKKLKQGKTVEEALAEILKKEVIFFQGKEFLGLTELSCYYGQDVSLIWERLSNGMNLEEALFSLIRRRNKPQCKIKYHGITYESKRDFSRKMKISMFEGEAIRSNCIAISEYFPITSDDTVLVARPLYHCAVIVGEVLTALYNGCNILFYSDTYNPIVLSRILCSNYITVMCGTPTIFKGISEALTFQKKQTQLKVIALSGEYLLPERAKSISRAF